MKQLLFIFLLAVSLAVTGFSADDVGSGDNAIKVSDTLDSADGKINYLISQANSFYNSEQFDQVIKIAQYILQHIDANSDTAKSLLEKAKDALVQAAQGKLSGVTKGLPGFGK